MKIIRRLHPVFANPNRLKISQVFGKYQYICSSPKGKISVVSLPNYFGDGVTLFEIFSFNNLFDDVERYKTEELALKRCREILE